MRVRLEKYYRIVHVFAWAWFVQVCIILALMADEFKFLLQANMGWYSAFEFFNLCFVVRHLRAKDRDKYREWRRREVTIKTSHKVEADTSVTDVLLS